MDSRRPSGSEKMNEPKVIGEVLNEYFRSDEPLARGYRMFLDSEKSCAEKGGEV
ncbi:MAG: hypothetical protein IK000_09545 [Bacteroidaceae bacterium]|nr:hypothetical protein [Bacteroidaceae bacterium]